MPATEILARNLAYFREHHPETATILESAGEPLSSVVYGPAGEPEDIDLGSGRLYKTPAKDFVETQLDDYFRHPQRVLIDKVPGLGLDSRSSVDLANTLLGRLGREGLASLMSAPQVAETGILFVFGCGLGLHVPRLVERTRLSCVVIVEPFPEFLAHSLSTVDWAGLGNGLDAAGGQLHFILSDTPDAILRRIGSLIDRPSLPCLDGSYVFTHYRNWIFDQLHDRMQAAASAYFIARGYFEDEVKMMTNVTGNFSRHSWRLLEQQARLKRAEPVFIIGSGPSLDADLAHVRRWQDRAVIFSCGTALHVLLRAGIRPDFHVELENGELLVEILGDVRRTYGLEGITLVGSTTLHPDVAALFDDVVFFFRDSVSSTKTFGRGYRNLDGAAPTCTNSAFATALTLGFRDIHLFGVDCGARDPARKDHSTESVYFTMDRLKNHKRPEYSLVQPGNFGGTVRSNWVYDMTRQMLEALQRVYRANLFNCSDGAMIKGSTPKAAASLTFPASAADKGQLKQALLRDLPHFEPGAFFSHGKVAGYLAKFDLMWEEALAAIDAGMAEDKTIHAFHQRLRTFFAAGGDRYDGVDGLVNASAMTWPRIAMFFIYRMPDEQSRQRLLQAFFEDYRKAFVQMCASGREIFAAVQQNVASCEATAVQ